ncbi:hypothetical protein BH24ACT8_BH24ACT8_18900 [soil metagenome]
MPHTTLTGAVGLLAALLLTACAPQVPETEEASTPTTPPVQDPAETSAASQDSGEDTGGPTDTSVEEPTTAELQVGDTVPLLDWGGDQIGSVTLDDVETDHACAGDSAERPANEQFLALSFTVQTDSTVDESTLGAWVNPYDFEVRAPGGELEPDSIGNSYLCADFADLLPSRFEADQRASGVVVLDTTVEEGFIVWTMAYQSTAAPYEIPFGD